MTTEAQEILDRALQLPVEQRIAVAQELWDSLDHQEAAIAVADDDGLMAEIERRSAEIESGAVTPLTHAQLIAGLQDDENIFQELERRDAEMDIEGNSLTREECMAEIRRARRSASIDTSANH